MQNEGADFMKKNIVRIVICAVFSVFCLGINPVVKAQDANSNMLLIKETKKLHKEMIKQKKIELKEEQKAQKAYLKQSHKQAIATLKNEEKKEKLNAINAKKQAKIDKKQAKIDRKNNLKSAKAKAKEDFIAAKKKAKDDFIEASNKEKNDKKFQKQQLKAERAKAKIKNADKKAESIPSPNAEDAKRAHETAERIKETRKVQKENVEEIFGETSVISHENSSKRRHTKVEEEVKPEEIAEAPVKKEEPAEIKEVSHKKVKKEDAIIDIDEAEEELQKSIEKNKEEYAKKEEKEGEALVHKNYSYEEIDKNAVSINEFLQFTDQQNEKFSVFYYKTTSKLSAYNESIKKKEKEIYAIRKDDTLSVDEQLQKVKKLKKETDNLYFARDNFYNDSLSKFNSILNKKQKAKWEILQEMGYRFLPDIN